MTSDKLVLSTEELQARQTRPSPPLDEESSPTTRDWGDERRWRTRWILALIVSFLVGFSLGVILHDQIVKVNPREPVWKSFPLD